VDPEIGLDVAENKTLPPLLDVRTLVRCLSTEVHAAVLMYNLLSISSDLFY
jgi:hypothetical protein